VEEEMELYVNDEVKVGEIEGLGFTGVN